MDASVQVQQCRLRFRSAVGVGSDVHRRSESFIVLQGFGDF